MSRASGFTEAELAAAAFSRNFQVDNPRLDRRENYSRSGAKSRDRSRDRSRNDINRDRIRERRDRSRSDDRFRSSRWGRSPENTERILKRDEFAREPVHTNYDAHSQIHVSHKPCTNYLYEEYSGNKDWDLASASVPRARNDVKSSNDLEVIGRDVTVKALEETADLRDRTQTKSRSRSRSRSRSSESRWKALKVWTHDKYARDTRRYDMIDIKCILLTSPQ